MAREARTEKILVLGVDGLEPRLCKKLMDEGKLPNIKKYTDEMKIDTEIGVGTTITLKIYNK